MSEQVKLNEPVTVVAPHNPTGKTGTIKDGLVVSDGQVVSLSDHLKRISKLAAKSPKAKKVRKANWYRMMATRYPNHPKYGAHKLEANLVKAGEK